ncbi:MULTISPECIES: formyltetrahydrofolate deformylase [Marinomonas]|uniref:formyltetrahydrofolate deformylase n=1 Tax=Marinomonas TaxID=28253 RepID=UPI00105472EC|nr:formyltetrahydrofolate deformylase [Marinomonas flavescens]
MPRLSGNFIITASCGSEIGTVDVLTRFLFDKCCYVVDVQSFDDQFNRRFFIRAEFKFQPENEEALVAFRQEFDDRAKSFDMKWDMFDAATRPKVLIMVSKYAHCLNDLLYRYRTNQLKIDIPAIISNHPDLEELAKWHGIPYYHFPITAETKVDQEKKVRQVMKETDSELVVLARYMQVLSPDMCDFLEHKAINIHHSLLPGFKGAKPYHQAHNRGVKLVGATAHYVNNDLDEGPIIEQVVEPVDHTYYPEDMVERGQDAECIALARAVQLHCERRVFPNGNRTVVFR